MYLSISFELNLISFLPDIYPSVCRFVAILLFCNKYLLAHASVPFSLSNVTVFLSARLTAEQCSYVPVKYELTKPYNTFFLRTVSGTVRHEAADKTSATAIQPMESAVIYMCYNYQPITNAELYITLEKHCCSFFVVAKYEHQYTSDL